MKKIKILYILPQAQQGGAETQMLNLLRNLDTTEFTLYLGMLYENKQLEKEFCSIEGLEIVDFAKNGLYDLFVYSKIASFIKKNNIDIVQTFLGNHHAYLPALLAGKIKCICGIRATGRPKSFSLILTKYLLPKFILNFMDILFVSNSEEGKKIYAEKGIPSDKIQVIPNGIDAKRFTKGKKNKVIKEFNLEKKFVLGIVARIVDSKNHEMLIKMIYELKKESPNIALLIVGDGPHKKTLVELSRELKLDKEIVFTGNRNDIPDLLSAMDIFVFPSLFPEGWPNAVGEAMAAGRPVIAYDTGDIKYIIKNGYNGIVTSRNSEIFKEELLKLIKDKAKREHLGKNAQKTVLENFTIKKMVSGYEEIYKGFFKADEK